MLCVVSRRLLLLPVEVSVSSPSVVEAFDVCGVSCIAGNGWFEFDGGESAECALASSRVGGVVDSVVARVVQLCTFALGPVVRTLRCKGALKDSTVALSQVEVT